MLWEFKALETEPAPLVFFHFMKTGGTTLHAYLEQRYATHDIFPGRHWYSWEEPSTSVYRLYSGHFLFSQIATISGYWVTVLRNPVERVISEYLHWRRTSEEFFRWNPAYRPLRELALKYDLLEFILRERESGFAIANRQTYQIMDMLYGVSDALSPQVVLSKAKQRLLKFHWVGVTEFLEGLIEMLALFWGWPFPKPLPTHRVRTVEYPLSSSLRRRLERLCALDMELYLWARDLYEKQRRAIWASFLGSDEFPSRELRLQLLTQRYQEAYQRYFPILQTSFTWTCDQPLFGSGWLARWPVYLRQGRRNACWTGPSAQATLDIPVRRDQPLQVEITVADAVVPVEQVRFYIEGISYQAKWRRENDLWVGVFEIPQSETSLLPYTRLIIDTITTGKVTPPYEGSPLPGGIAVLSVRVLPYHKTSKPNFWHKGVYKIRHFFKRLL